MTSLKLRLDGEVGGHLRHLVILFTCSFPNLAFGHPVEIKPAEPAVIEGHLMDEHGRVFQGAWIDFWIELTNASERPLTIDSLETTSRSTGGEVRTAKMRPADYTWMHPSGICAYTTFGTFAPGATHALQLLNERSECGFGPRFYTALDFSRGSPRGAVVALTVRGHYGGSHAGEGVFRADIEFTTR